MRAAYPTEADRIQESNIGAVPISALRITLKYPKGMVSTEPTNPGVQPSFPVSIPAKTRDDADAIEAWLQYPRAELRCEYTYRTRKLKENSTRVTMKNLRNSKIILRLDGNPKDGDKVYIHRDQLQQLAEGFRQEFSAILHPGPDPIDVSVTNGLIALWSKQLEVDADKWNEVNRCAIHAETSLRT